MNKLYKSSSHEEKINYQSKPSKCHHNGCKCFQFQFSKFQPKKCTNCKHQRDDHLARSSDTKSPKRMPPSAKKTTKPLRPPGSNKNTMQRQGQQYQQQQQQYQQYQQMSPNARQQQQPNAFAPLGYQPQMNSMPMNTQHIRARSKTVGHRQLQMQQQQMYKQNAANHPNAMGYPPPPNPNQNNHLQTNSMQLQMSASAPFSAAAQEYNNNMAVQMNLIARNECVWKRSLCLRPDYAKNFGCILCGDIPRSKFAYTCDKGHIYCEYCIDGCMSNNRACKIDNQQIHHKSRLPNVLENMINALKIKCPEYNACKWKGSIAELYSHYDACLREQEEKERRKQQQQQQNQKRASSPIGKIGQPQMECPLKSIGCIPGITSITKHLTDFEVQHWSIMLHFVTNHMRNLEKSLNDQLGDMQEDIEKLQNENDNLVSSVKKLKKSNDTLHNEIKVLRQQGQNNFNNQNINNNNNKKSAIKAPPKAKQPPKAVLNIGNKYLNSINKARGVKQSSFVDAHRRLSTQSGMTVPEDNAQKHGNLKTDVDVIPEDYDSDDSESEEEFEIPHTGKAVVLDIGSSTTKVGMAGSNKPAFIFPTLIAKHKHKNQPSYLVGDIGPNFSKYNVIRPVVRGVISNMNDYNLILQDVIYERMGSNAQDFNVLLVQPILTKLQQSEQMIATVFEKVQLNGAYLALDALCSLYASGGNTGLSFCSGHGLTTVVPVYEGFPIMSAAQKTNLAGVDITEELSSRLNLKRYFHSSLQEQQCATVIKERYCYAAKDYLLEKNEINSNMSNNIGSYDAGAMADQKYKLPDGRELEINIMDRFSASELMFSLNATSAKRKKQKKRNSLKNKMTLIPQFLENVWDKTPEEHRRLLFENIVCSGGNTLLKGFDDRLQKEVEHMCSRKTNQMWQSRIFGLVDRRLSCWIGGSIMASLTQMDSLWITKKEYDEHGTNVLHRQK